MPSFTPPKQRSSSTGTTESQYRNENSVISLQQFAHSKSKGTRRAIETYRQKRQNKFNHRAGLVRGYRKVLKTEGFEQASHKGGSSGDRRKRNFETALQKNDTNLDDIENDEGGNGVVRDDDNEAVKNNKSVSDNASSETDGHVDAKIRANTHTTNGRIEGKRPKFDPFAKARAKAKRNKEAQIQHQEYIQTQLKLKEGKLKNRKKRSKVMSKRTRRGQPIMKNVIGAMLGKLQEESKTEV